MRNSIYKMINSASCYKSDVNEVAHQPKTERFDPNSIDPTYTRYPYEDYTPKIINYPGFHPIYGTAAHQPPKQQQQHEESHPKEESYSYLYQGCVMVLNGVLCGMIVHSIEGAVAGGGFMLA